MSKALIIKGANFAEYAVETITLSDPVPCTGITLDQNTATITSVGSTLTLTATPTPAITTDAVVWTSSNTSVATVSGGVVTAQRIGTATITATCGSYSATCAVTVTQIVEISTAINMYMSYHSSGYLQGGELENYAIGYSDSGTKMIYAGSSGKYPIPIPDGANNLVITCPDLYPYGFWMSSTEGVEIWDAVAVAFPVDGFETTTTKDARTVEIPDRTTGDYEGMNAVGIVFRYMDGTITETMLSNIVITFTA